MDSVRSMEKWSYMKGINKIKSILKKENIPLYIIPEVYQSAYYKEIVGIVIDFINRYVEGYSIENPFLKEVEKLFLKKNKNKYIFSKHIQKYNYKDNYSYIKDFFFIKKSSYVYIILQYLENRKIVV